MSSQLEYPRV